MPLRLTSQTGLYTTARGKKKRLIPPGKTSEVAHKHRHSWPVSISPSMLTIRQQFQLSGSIDGGGAVTGSERKREGKREELKRREEGEMQEDLKKEKMSKNGGIGGF